MERDSKRCPRCGDTKPIEGNFYVGKKGPGGYCISCTKEKAVAWQKANPERKAAADHRHYASNPERRRKVRERLDRWEVEHPEQAKALAAANSQRYAQEHPDRVALIQSRYSKSPAGRAAQARYRAKAESKAKHAAEQRAYRKTLVAKIREHLRSAQRYGYEVSARTLDLLAIWEAVVARFNGACAYCGAAGDAMSLAVDRVVPRAAGGGDEPGNIVPACTPCNSSKKDRSLAAFCAERGIDAAGILVQAAG